MNKTPNETPGNGDGSKKKNAQFGKKAAPSRKRGAKKQKGPVSPIAKKVVNIIRDFLTGSPGNVLDLGNRVLTKMTGNTLLLNPEPSLKTLRDSLTELQDKYNISSVNRIDPYGTHTELARQATALVLDSLATWVEDNCEDSAMIASTSGFDLQKEAGGIVPAPPMCTNLAARDSDMPNEFWVSVDAIKLSGIRYYAEIREKNGDGVWRPGGDGSSFRKIVVKGIVPMVEYLIDVYAKTAKGESPRTGKPITWSIRNH